MKRIDMAIYPRREHFNHFVGMAYPYVGVTVEVDVTDLLARCREKGYSFYLMVLHAVALAADEVPEFRRRIDRGGIEVGREPDERERLLADRPAKPSTVLAPGKAGIVEYDECPTSHTELKPDGTYAYCTLHHHMPLADYLAKAEAARAATQESGSIEEEDDVKSMYFISTLPWLHYTQLVQPVACGEESNPRITWGKYQPDAAGRMMMPLSVLVHHALADGLHIAQFYEAFDRVTARLCKEE
ncbi:MAG: chloramphenicol acetyltransferase [Clostridia bacterium]|nr:chloramphenicol acetyltransferase [Clostridia bacterium]